MIGFRNRANRATGLPVRGLSLALVAFLLFAGFSSPALFASAPVLAAESTGAPAHELSAEEQDDLPLPSAIQFPVIFKNDIDSKRTKVGDQITCTLKEDIMVGGRLVAAANSEIIGRVQVAVPAKTLTKGMTADEKKFHRGSVIKVVFDEIVTTEGEHIPVIGCISKQSVKIGDSDQPRQIIVGPNGEILKAEQCLTNSQQVIGNVLKKTTNSGLSTVACVATLGILPVAMGLVGAITPSTVYGKPVYEDEGHPRLKGMTKGFVDNFVGAPVLDKMVFKGDEINIYEGDELMVQAHSPYGGPSDESVSAKIVGSKGKDKNQQISDTGKRTN